VIEFLVHVTNAKLLKLNVKIVVGLSLLRQLLACSGNFGLTNIGKIPVVEECRHKISRGPCWNDATAHFSFTEVMMMNDDDELMSLSVTMKSRPIF